MKSGLNSTPLRATGLLLPIRLSNSTHFLVFADFGTCSSLSTHTLTALTAHTSNYDFYMLPGDIVYNLNMCNGVRGDAFLNGIEGFAALVHLW